MPARATRTVVQSDHDRILLTRTAIGSTRSTRSPPCLHRSLVHRFDQTVQCLLIIVLIRRVGKLQGLNTPLDQGSTDLQPSTALVLSTGIAHLPPPPAFHASRATRFAILLTVCSSVLPIKEATVRCLGTRRMIQRSTAVAVQIGLMARDQFRRPHLTVVFPPGQPARSR